MSDVDEAIASGRVPPDRNITAEYLKESRDKPTIAGILVVTSLTCAIVVARLLSRAFMVRRFGYDDGLALVSLVRRLRTRLPLSASALVSPRLV